ncbi:MAG: class II glutamine amidotransferase [Candidatus Dormibacteria bacterium]
MCELLLVAWPEPKPFEASLPWVESLERFGLGGYGWGVAWREEGEVRTYRHPSSLAQDPVGRQRTAAARSTHFLVHLRRPSNLSQISLADTQPFRTEGGEFAFAHNGRLDGAEQERANFAGLLQGRADSEVGFRLLQRLLQSGWKPDSALLEVHRRLGGTANFGYLPARGPALAYAGSTMNSVWRFEVAEAQLAATALHSGDQAVFDLCFAGARDRRLVPVGSAVAVGEHEVATSGSRGVG